MNRMKKRITFQDRPQPNNVAGGSGGGSLSVPFSSTGADSNTAAAGLAAAVSREEELMSRLAQVTRERDEMISEKKYWLSKLHADNQKLVQLHKVIDYVSLIHSHTHFTDILIFCV
jgi:hypothetical protein